MTGWFSTLGAQSLHYLQDGKPLCSEISETRWTVWLGVKPDDIDHTKCCRKCKGLYRRPSIFARKRLHGKG
jgi:hypothetical protein